MKTVLRPDMFPGSSRMGFEPALTDVRCPKCKSSTFLLIEVSEAYTCWDVDEGRLSMGEGNHDPGDVLRLEGACDCGHRWRIRKGWQVTQVTTKLDPVTLEPVTKASGEPLRRAQAMATKKSLPEPNWITDERGWMSWYRRRRHTAWESVEEIRRRWSAITLSDGTSATVGWHAGQVLHYAKFVCDEIGAPYRIEWFNWDEPQRYVCIRIYRNGEQVLCISSADCYGDLELDLGRMKVWLTDHRERLAKIEPGVARP